MAAQEDEEEERPRRQRRSRSRGKPRAESAASGDAVETREVGDQIHGMEVVEPEGDVDMGDEEGSSPMERVHETPVEEPARDEDDEDGEEREERDAPLPRDGRRLATATKRSSRSRRRTSRRRFPGRGSPSFASTRSRKSSRSVRSCSCRS